MKLEKITAIFDEFRLPAVEAVLLENNAMGFTLHSVRGRGAYFDSFNRDHLVKHVQMEVYVPAECSAELARCIIDVAHVDADSEGLVAITSVQDLLWIHTKQAVTEGDFTCKKGG